MSIRLRAVLAIVITNLVIILLSIVAGMGHARSNIEKYIEADMLVVADIADRFISAELKLLRDDAEDAAAAIAEAGPAGWADALAEQMRALPEFTGMAILNRNAGIAASAGAHPASPALRENASIQSAFAGKTSFTSTLPVGDGVAFHLAAPLPGDAAHVLVLTLDGMHFANLVSGYAVWETGHIFIDDAEGNVIANVRPEWVRGRENFLLRAREDDKYRGVAAVIEKAVAGGRGIDFYSMDGVPRICAYRPISSSGEGWFLGIVAPLSESPLRNFDRGLLLIAAISLLLNIAMAIAASGFIRKPFEEIAALKEAAEANSRAKTNFLANMSHEIRTPLNAVVGLSELALEGEKPGSERADRLEKIHSSGMTILSIVNDILDISKIEAGRFEIQSVEYALPSMVNDVVAQNAVRIGSKPVRFVLDIDESLPARLVGDELRIKQIVNNLLSNAFKYTEEGVVELGVACSREGEGVRMRLRVRDTGLGIRPEDVGGLFVNYARAGAGTNRAIGGTGLGLSITKMLAEMMGGRVSVESEYGKGSVFTVELRQGAAGDAVIGAATAENLRRFRYSDDRRRMSARTNRVRLPRARVLVVDDNATNLDIARGILKPYGMRVDCVTGGRQAVEAVRAGTPRYDAVFMDHMMPEMDGVEATRRIRELGGEYAGNIPVIALTANAIVGTEAMFLRNGFQAFIPKPIDLARLDEVIRRFVRDSAPETPGEAPPEAGRELDMARGLERFGDEKSFLRILRSYAVNTKSLLDGIRTVDGANMAAYATTVHGIKGSSRNICAEALGDRAEALERAAKAGDGEFVLRNNPAFLEAAEKLISEIEALLDADARAHPRPRKAAPDRRLLIRLRDACVNYDFDAVEEAMDALDRHEYDADGELLARLRDAVLRMDFAAVAESLKTL